MLIFANKHILLIVIMLSVVMLNVVAPTKCKGALQAHQQPNLKKRQRVKHSSLFYSTITDEKVL
jgi:hypothetical protein